MQTNDLTLLALFVKMKKMYTKSNVREDKLIIIHIDWYMKREEKNGEYYRGRDYL